MPRPLLPRRVCCRARIRGLRPMGPGGCAAPAVVLTLDELEAVRLADREGLYQDAAADRMGVSRQTFARILSRGRAALAECVVEGKRLIIETGTVREVPNPQPACPVHGTERRGRFCHCPHRVRPPRAGSEAGFGQSGA